MEGNQNYYEYDYDDGYIDEDEEEMPATEKELADDAQWKIIQKNTFTRWANEHLKQAGKQLADLQYDLSDGLRLLSLVEVLAGHKFRHVNKRPNFRTQKLENVTMTLKFLEEEEGIRLVNIDSSDIVDCKLKLILGLIWTLILHYSISMPMWEGEEELPQDGKGPTPRQRLLGWINSKMPDKPINNFTTDWNDGTAIGALVDACAPGLCPDWDVWDVKKPLENCTEAMDAAEQWMDVPQLIRPEEMVNPRVDEKAMMTYLSQFPNAKLKPGAPLRPKTNPARVRAYGPGLEPEGNTVGAPARFTVETFSAGRGSVEIIVLNPRGQKEPCEVIFNNDRNLTYSCAYTPTMEGEYRVIVKFSNQEIPRSPYKVIVEGAAGDPSRVTASGPGIEPTGNQVAKRTFFNIFTAGAGPGSVDCVILDPHGQRDTIKPRVTHTGQEDVYLVEYTPREEGLHSVNVFFAGQQIPGSPFGVEVAGNYFPERVYVTGRGIQPKGVRINEQADFYVHVENAGEGECRVQVIAPGGGTEPCKVERTSDAVYTCLYVPHKAGRYTVIVKFGPQEVPRSPFPVDVAPQLQSNIRAYGPGLEGGWVNEPAIFTVESNGETGALGFSIEGPSEAQIQCSDNGDGSADVVYYPTAPGEYAVHVLCNEQDIPRSPFMPLIAERQPQLRPDQVRAYGPGIGVPEPVSLPVGQPAAFTLDTRATNGPPELVSATVYNPRGDPIPLDVRQQSPGLLQCSYVPQEPGKHTTTVSYAGVSAPGSPFRAFVAEPVRPDLVRVSGPGVERAVRNQPTYFNVDYSQAGPGEVGVGVRPEPNGPELPVKTTEAGPGQLRVDYTPVQVVPHLVNVAYAGQPAGGGPFRVPVEPDIEVDKVRVDGLEPTIPLGLPHEFDILTGGNPRAPVSVRIRPPAGPPTQPMISETVDGYAVEFTPTMPGPHTVEVEFAGRKVPQSPLRTNVVPAGQEEMMSPRRQTPMQYGQQPQSQQPQFGGPQQQPQRQAPWQQQPVMEDMIDPRRQAPKQAGFAPQGQQPVMEDMIDPRRQAPKQAGFAPQGQQPVMEDMIDPRRQAPKQAGFAPQGQQPVMEDMIDPRRQAPKQTGFAPQPVAVTPYDASATPQRAQGPPANVRAYGDGLSKAATGIPARFTIDSRDAPNIPLGVNVEGPSKADIRCQDNGDGTADVDYTVTEPGQYKVNVLAAGQHVAGSPFTVTAVRSGYEGVDPKKVRAYGPGLQPHGVFRESFAKFTVDATALDRSGKGQVSGVVNAPSKQRSAARVENKGSGMYECSYCPLEEGPYQVEVLYEGLHVMGSPFPVKVSNGCDPRRVRAFGPGLQGGFADEPAQFTVELGTAGQGGLSLAVEGPSEAPIKCQDNKDGTCSVQYTPSEPGTYDVVVKFADVDIPGSPFPVRIDAKTAPNKVTAYGPGLETGKVRCGVPATFTVDASRAGPGQLAATVTQAGQTKPCASSQQPSQPGLYAVGYTPEREGPTKVNVMYAGQQVPKSPFSVHTLPKCEPHKVVVTGEGVRSSGVLASLPTEFCIDTTDAGEGDLQVTIEDSEGRPVTPRIEPQKSGQYLCKYTPADVGRYTVGVKYGGVEVPESPYHVRTEPTGDAEKVKVVVPPESSVPAHQEAVITVDTSDAGNGKVTCRIRAPNDSELDIDLEENDDGTVSLYYTPRMPGMQTIEIKFGGQVIPNGEIKQQVIDDYNGAMQDVVEEVGAQKATPSNLQPSAYHPVDFKLPVGPVFSRVEALIRTPNGRTARPSLVDNEDGTVTFKYQPTERGMHELTVLYNDQPITGSPFKFFVESVGTGHVTAYGPGLSHGRTGEPAEFTIVTKDAGAGGLALAIEGPSRAEINCNDNKDGTCSVNYLPLAPGDYTIVVKFMEHHIPGSPFTARISGEPRRRAEVSVGQANEIPLKITETDITGLTASITGPDGLEEPCVLKRLPNGHLGIAFTPKQVGEHQVAVYRAGRHIPNSPFRIDVAESDIGDAQRVRVSGRGLEEGMAGQANAFTVDTRKAGYGGLSLSVEGPSKADIECHDNQDGTCLVTYTPTEPGTYLISVRYADQHVPGSPFSARVGGVGGTAGKAEVTGPAEEASATHVGSQCELSLRIPGTNPFDMTATVTAPSGLEESAEIVDLDECQYAVRFVPREAGVHAVAVRHRGVHVPGSPFQFTVGPLAGGGLGAKGVRVAGEGIERGQAGRANEFGIYTREAGAGGLAIAVEGPAKAEINFQDRRDGWCAVNWTVPEPGDYTVSVKFDGRHVTGSPFHVPVTGGSGGTTRGGTGQSLFEGVNQPAALTLRGVAANTVAVITAPSGARTEAPVQEIPGTDQAVVRFTPKETGSHLVEVPGAEGSPFRIMVSGGQLASGADPGAVRAEGEGLHRGRVGQRAKFLVHTANAGSGALAVTVDGPSKVQLNCHERENGYEFTYLPSAPGEYIITIKYGGNFHIVGSPFTAHVTGEAEAVTEAEQLAHSALLVETRPKQAAYPERVICRGDALRQATANQEMTFSVDASRAGYDMLLVGILGPADSSDSVRVQHESSGRYTVRYQVTSPGPHLLTIKWGDEHVPGSPFRINVT